MSELQRPRGELEIFSGTAHPELALEVAIRLDRTLGRLNVSRFPDGEIHVQIEESVRGKDVFVIQPTCPPVNENFTELLIILDALYRASAGRITAVIPYYGYARQDKKTTGREPITARMVADMLTTGGADRIVAMDLHSPQIQGFFRIPVDHLTAVGALCRELHSLEIKDAVIVSPDAGRVKLATEYANRLGLPVVIIHKRRVGPELTEAVHVVGDVKGKRPIIIDDMITTGGTIERSVKALLEHGAREEIYVAATHPVFVEPAISRLANAAIKQVLVTNTIPFPAGKTLKKFRIVSIAHLIADAIRSIHTDSSVSQLFV
ncbi:MAG: ribose-phosphate pyrophosphokinase [Armatimonadetes bacterium]|nr:ribose-phosphate pyrophosphokinase [Armatimonadota bacterium]